MSKWAVHKKWDSKLGTPSQVLDYMQKAIDSRGPSDKKIIMPEDFKKHCKEEKIIIAGHKNWAIADLKENLHDRGKNAPSKNIKVMIQEEDLKFLLSKGESYVKAYYLHFILDYLDKMRFWMNNTGDSIEDCIDKYMKNQAVSVPGTSQHLVYVVDFLKNNSEEVQKSFNL